MFRDPEITQIGRPVSFRDPEITQIGRPMTVNDWSDEAPTSVEEPFLLCVRKLEAPPGDELEELETVRGHLHETVDHLVDRALESVGELRALVERTQRREETLVEELECVVRHSNALVEKEMRRPRRDTLVEFPTARRLHAV
jgi:hypothetical protein